MAIVDQFGRPIERDALTEPQTANLASLHSEFAGHPIKGLTPSKLASILNAAELGDITAQCDLFEDMEDRDGHILTEIGKRKRALLTLDWDVVAPDDASAAEKKDAAYAKEMIQSLPDFEDVLFDLGDGIGKGFSAVEIEWSREGREWFPRGLEFRTQRWFQLDTATRSKIMLRDSSAGPDGAELRPFGWMLHTHRAKSGYIARAALYRTLTWPFLFKWWSSRDIAEFLEIYGLPMRLGIYPSGASDDEKSTLLRAVVSLGHNAGGIIPEGMMVEFKEAAKGTHEPFAYWIDFCERTQSKAILGQTLSAEAKSTGMGSGVADLQGEVRDDLKKSDARQMAGTITRDLIVPFLMLNGRAIDPRRAPRFKFDTGEAEDLKLYADAIPNLVSVGLPITVAWAQEKLRIPAPKDGEAILHTASSGAAVDPGGQPAGTAAARAEVSNTVTAEEKDGVDIQTDRLAQEAAEPVDKMISFIDGLVANAASLEALRDDILSAYGRLPSEDLQAVMARAYATAQASGRYDVTNE